MEVHINKIPTKFLALCNRKRLEPKHTDTKEIFMNILLAGGTGSFGRAFLDHLSSTGHSGKIRVFSRDEAKQYEMLSHYPNLDLDMFIGDVRSLDTYTQAAEKMQIVIHAAALKQVPTAELHTEEAIKTNTLGAINCVKACKRQGVKKALYLSTDKAVYPINAYGMSKGLGEKVMQSREAQSAETDFFITRYGNILGSRGSILPVIHKRVEKQQPLHITDFAMTRFLMGLEEAVELVNYALKHAADGDILVRYAPAGLLKPLINSYLQWVFNTSLEDYPYEMIGVRQGEKLHEYLATHEELSRAHYISEKQILHIRAYHHEQRPSNTLPLMTEYKEGLCSQTVECLDEAAILTLLKRHNVDRIVRKGIY